MLWLKFRIENAHLHLRLLLMLYSRPSLRSGMMVYISVKELVPTALRYDPQDSVATTCVVAGMVVMAASLLLFTL